MEPRGEAGDHAESANILAALDKQKGSGKG